MTIEKATRTLLGVAALCGLLVNAGCSSVPGGSPTGELDTTSGSTSGQPIAAIKAPGDWAMSMLATGRVGLGMFPAKFTFDITATPSCANDFVTFNTSLTGVSPTAAASRTGTVSGTPTNGQTATIGGTLVLTASTTDNTGTNFLIGGTTTITATNLRDAIIRNGASVGVTASSVTNVVTVTATANGSQGNAITLVEGMTGFAWAGGTLIGGLGTGNIVAFNQLYSTQGSAGGLCNQDGPSVYWSYFTGTGQALTSVVLSGDGTKVAYVENAAGGATLRILKWKAGEGTGTGYPTAPTTTLSAGQSWAADCPVGNSCLRSIAFNGAFQDTGSAPFYNYNTDTLYVGDNSSRVHKFTGVFNGTPAEVVVGWPIQVNGTANLSSAVYDGVSGNIYVGDDTGRLSYIREVGSTVGACGAGSPPCLGSTSQQVGTAGAIIDAPIVDGTTGMVLAFNGTDTLNRGSVLQATTALASPVTFDIGGTAAGSALYGGAFDNTYINSSPPSITGHMYVCGKDPGFNNRPTIYQLSFNGTGVLTGVGTALTGLVNASGSTCSPVTEIYNPNAVGGAKDWIFFSVGNDANTADPIPAGTCRTNNGGCLISIDVTGNPTWPPTVVTNARAMPPNDAGSTSGIVVDNVADTVTSPEASSIYLSYGANSVAAAPCNGVNGVGCAVKLTQSGLQ